MSKKNVALVKQQLINDGYEFEAFLPYDTHVVEHEYVLFHIRKIQYGPLYRVFVKKGGIHNSPTLVKVANAVGYYYLKRKHENIYTDNTSVIEIPSKWN